MEKQPLITVIIPVYKVEDRLDACLETVVGQSYKNLQIILVDDGSPDKSGEICDNWAKKDERVEVIHKENGGMSSARNAGLEIMRGDYVFFMDSDDLLDLETITILYNVIINHNADIASSYQLDVFDPSSVEFVRDEQVTVMDRETAICDIWYQRIWPSACAKLYKSSLFDDLRFTNGLYYEDVDIIYQIYWKAERIAQSASKLYGYIHHSGTVTTSAFSKKDLDILKITDKIGVFVEDKSEALKNAAKAYSCATALRFTLNAPKKEEFKEGINKAKNTLKQNAKSVLKDKNIKNKVKMALILYLYFRPFIGLVYRFVDRWK